MADRKRIPVRGRMLDDDEDEDDLVGPRTGGAPRSRARPEPRAEPRPRPRAHAESRPRSRGSRRPARRGGDRAWLRSVVRDIPNVLKLLWGLARDPRVSKTDKAIVGAALAYTALPADLIPDWIPVLGEVEDVLLIALALSRLLGNAGEDVVLDHWDGDDETLHTLLDALDGAAEYIPGPIRNLIGGRR
ncbi:YkvA family protein [Longimicrobium sp.]|uniref:YkvA family protein n=1 Tax=Longimicrobium sp. TaxID=2029185 RepID=UPI002C402FB5|nr:YkvA family protein [Longimicrobium sp.]HSU12553.1 YkvA family protein [Longimicrobium sp.]